MANFVEKMAVVEAATIYEGSALVGNDYTVTLPGIVPVTVDVGGLMGTVNIPLLSRIESAELNISKIGVDDNAVRINSPGKKDLIIKWAQDKVDSAGNVKAIGCKAEITCLPKSYMPEAEIEVGSASEFDCTYEVLIYKLYIDGKCRFQLNRMTNLLKAWNGKKLVDFSADFSKLL